MGESSCFRICQSGPGKSSGNVTIIILYHSVHNVWAMDWKEWGYRVFAPVSLPWKNLLFWWFRFIFCPSSKAFFVKHLWKFSVSSWIFNKVHLRVLNSLGNLTFFTCVNYWSTSHRGVGLRIAVSILAAKQFTGCWRDFIYDVWWKLTGVLELWWPGLVRILTPSVLMGTKIFPLLEHRFPTSFSSSSFHKELPTSLGYKWKIAC